jgi:hypothetical protein
MKYFWFIIRHKDRKPQIFKAEAMIARMLFRSMHGTLKVVGPSFGPFWTRKEAREYLARWRKR